MSDFLERRIIMLLQEKNEEALSLLYKHYAPTLYGVAYKLTTNHNQAEDVLQESFVKVWKNARSYDPLKAKLFTWLYRIVHNTAVDSLRKKKSQPTRVIQIEDSPVYNMSAQEYDPTHLDVKMHVDNLEPRYGAVLDALFFKGMTHQEASQALNVPLGTVKSRLKIGLRELKKIFDPT